ncbi:hypothetical protein M9H77_20792 [Catharanthus roseus]|uniref:Uncharacterized protein n=1 Tax=Catharanthus roseus TaxID=4058 RepID=A0ACC0AMS5_CATRO|nr:hypothetical protein M9H77_20792 [Catharanthus roseus]
MAGFWEAFQIQPHHHHQQQQQQLADISVVGVSFMRSQSARESTRHPPPREKRREEKLHCSIQKKKQKPISHSSGLYLPIDANEEMRAKDATIFMVVVQISLGGVSIFYKLASNDGMSMRVMVAYRFLFAAATVIPLALFLERNKRPKLTRMILFQAFLVAMFWGSLTQNLYAQSLVMTSATFASAITNLIPAITFILAAIFRLEKFEIKSKAGKAKVIGTLICIGGAMLLTFYKGLEIKMPSSLHFDLLNHKNNSGRHYSSISHKKSMNHIIGPLLALFSCFTCSIGLILQVRNVT